MAMTAGQASASARIAAELRDRSESGDLRPGSRMPSTRALVQRRGIAMATATKVLTTLRHEGLIHSVPGVGTVVTDRSPGGPGKARPGRERTDGQLDQAAIVNAGIAVADAEGLAALSMRRVAAELDAAPMSLYRHVDNKDELLHGM